MIKRYIQSAACCFPDPENESASVAQLIPDIPKRAARRMSTLGKQIHHMLNGVELDLDTSVIYGTTYTEARALETFLESIPFASPTAFQTSIHPGGIEQALIMDKREVAALFPIAGDTLIFLQMLQVAFTCSTSRTVLTGGEERGTWLQEFHLAAPRSFAFRLLLSRQPGDTVGEISWDPSAGVSDAMAPSLEEAARSIESRSSLVAGSPDHGQYTITWT